jgi:Tol biopolymer transport system component
MLSLSSSGIQGTQASANPSISADGRFVAFLSNSPNLVAGPSNVYQQVYWRDRQTGDTLRISQSTTGQPSNNHSSLAFVSGDGSRVMFWSYASDLVPGDTNQNFDVFVRDLARSVTVMVTRSYTGGPLFGTVSPGAISRDGRYVAFCTDAPNVVPGASVMMHVYVRDLEDHLSSLVDVSTAGAQANNSSVGGALSEDGRFVAFSSAATNLVNADNNGKSDIFVRDRQARTTALASIATNGTEANDNSDDARISGDGRFVLFDTMATNLVTGDTNFRRDVFLHDMQTGSTIRISTGPGGVQASDNCFAESISGDGRYSTFYSASPGLVPGDSNQGYDVFVYDRITATLVRADLTSAGGEVSQGATESQVSADGTCVVFTSNAPGLAPPDTNGTFDVFARDFAPEQFSSLCLPGQGAVQACPCQNPPHGSSSGCDNSASTGGATLSAAGSAQLHEDTLRFTTQGELPSALSVVVQGNVLVPGGELVGQGVSCLGGWMPRMYVKSAINGAILAPDSATGDPSVSARAASVGDVLHPGDVRYFTVWYRDPIVVGGCPAAALFNSTQTGRIVWWW